MGEARATANSGTIGLPIDDLRPEGSSRRCAGDFSFQPRTWLRGAGSIRIRRRESTRLVTTRRPRPELSDR